MAAPNTTKLVCLQCHPESKTAEGFCKTCNLHLCGPCYSSHRLPLPMKFHELIGKDAMPKVQTQLQSGDSKDTCTFICKDHQDIMKFYCKAHDMVICSECLNQHHKKCPETPKIADITNIEAEFQANKAKLSDIEKELKEVQQKSETQLLEVRKQSNTAKQDVEKFSKQIVVFNDKLAKEVGLDIDKIEKEDDRKMEQIKGKCRKETKRINELAQKLNALHEAKQNCDLFVNIKMSDKDVKAIQTQTLKDKGRNTIRKYHFVAESRLNEVVRDIKSYGNLVDGSGKKEVRKDVAQNRMGPLATSQRVIQVKSGKIEDEEADVIVNSATIDLNLKQGENTVTSSIATKAGPNAETSLKTVASGRQPKFGDVFDAEPGKLKCKRLYHVIMKDYPQMKPAESVELITKAITACLGQAIASGHRSISFPALGTGGWKYPADVAAKAFLNSALTVFASNQMSSLEIINIVVIKGDKSEKGEDKLTVFERELSREGASAGVQKYFALPNK